MPPIVQQLRHAAAALRDERVSMQAMAQAHGPDTQGALLLLLAVPCLLPVPGAGTVFGLGIAALALGMWRGHAAPCLPRRVAELEISRRWAQRVLGFLASAYALAGSHAVERLCRFASAGKRSGTAVAIGLMAAIIVMPVPFGNVLPALALILMGLALVFRDGLAMLLGMVVAALALFVTAGLLLMVWLWGSDWIFGLTSIST